MGFDEVSIGGVTLFLLILGLVEVAKKLGVSGNGSMILSICLGGAFFGLFKANEAGLIPAQAMLWTEVVVYGLGGGLAATGLYDLSKKLGNK